jgi:transcriptional regulator with XRE-family HTH domain
MTSHTQEKSDDCPELPGVIVALNAGKRLESLGMGELNHPLKILREEKDLSQQELATRADLSVMAISKLERGLHAPTSKTRRRLAAALGVSLDEFDRRLADGADTVSVELPRDVYNSILERSRHEGHATVAAFLAKVATTKTIRIIAPAEAESGAKRASRKIRAK